MNKILLDFLTNNLVIIILILGLLFPLIPPKWLDIDSTYQGADGMVRKRLRLSLSAALMQLLLQVLNQLMIGLLVLFNFKATISILIFIVVGVELYFRKQISQQAVVLVAISIIVLYLEQILEKGKSFKIWKFFEWESK